MVATTLMENDLDITSLPAAVFLLGTFDTPGVSFSSTAFKLSDGKIYTPVWTSQVAIDAWLAQQKRAVPYFLIQSSLVFSGFLQRYVVDYLIVDPSLADCKKLNESFDSELGSYSPEALPMERTICLNSLRDVWPAYSNMLRCGGLNEENIALVEACAKSRPELKPYELIAHSGQWLTTTIKVLASESAMRVWLELDEIAYARQGPAIITALELSNRSRMVGDNPVKPVLRTLYLKKILEYLEAVGAVKGVQQQIVAAGRAVGRVALITGLPQGDTYLQIKGRRDFHSSLLAQRASFKEAVARSDAQTPSAAEWLQLVERFIDQLAGNVGSDSGSRERIPSEVQREVWRRDGGKCVVCGSNIRLEFDHIIAVANGGSNTARNIQLLCERCNRAKGARVG